MRSTPSSVGSLFVFLVLALIGTSALAQADDCKNRGQLDTLYCDENKDLVADAPKDPKRWKNPSTLVFTCTRMKPPCGWIIARTSFRVVSYGAIGAQTAMPRCFVISEAT